MLEDSAADCSESRVQARCHEVQQIVRAKVHGLEFRGFSVLGLGLGFGV